MPPPPLPIGLTHSESMIVGPQHLVPAVAPDWPGLADMPPVFATAMMVGFMEQTCIQALRPYLARDQHSVGVHVDISHVSATAQGMTVTAQVELIAVEGKVLRFQVACYDTAGLIGAGTHQRALIDVPRFLLRVQSKAAAPT